MSIELIFRDFSKSRQAIVASGNYKASLMSSSVETPYTLKMNSIAFTREVPLDSTQQSKLDNEVKANDQYKYIAEDLNSRINKNFVDDMSTARELIDELSIKVKELKKTTTLADTTTTDNNYQLATKMLADAEETRDIKAGLKKKEEEKKEEKKEEKAEEKKVEEKVEVKVDEKPVKMNVVGRLSVKMVTGDEFLLSFTDAKQFAGVKERL